MDFQPKDLNEAVDEMLKNMSKDQENIEFLKKHEGDERGFISKLHMFFGRNIRNDWFLWWHEGHPYDSWPNEMPSIVKYFNNIQIYHADDMSGIILTSVYRKFFGLDLNLEEQISVYHDHWIKYSGNIDFRKEK
jgi:hypothetical protein